ncbi:G-protein coupled receptor Mth2-like [Musca autumnalis]|uniref:G-protein coupled receptor Mth2-like n=1 Tax=Musca autumnalis TaxID=221902 RepID=UPI003CEF7F9C
MDKGLIVAVVRFTLTMLIITCIGIFLISALTAREHVNEIKTEKCNFRDTVDLTNHLPFENGSYLYDDVMIPENETAFYNYTLTFRYKPRPAANHVRGCICDESKGRFCTKLCCERDEFFNQTSSRCEKLTKNMPNEMEILFMNETLKKANIFEHFIIQIGKPCKNLEEISKKDIPWILMEDGYLLIESHNRTVPLDTLNYCISPQYNNESHNQQLTVMSCPIKNEASRSMVLNSYAMTVSVVFFGLTIICYLVVDKLRNTLTGKLLTCYMIALAVGYSTIAYINIAREMLPVIPCRVVGFSGYYFFMSAYLWLGVMCFIMYKSVKKPYTVNGSTTWTRFIKYSTFVWGTAGIFTLILMWAQLSNVVPEMYKPDIGSDSCWLNTRKWIAAFYFHIPNGLIMIFNIFAFVQVTMEISKAKRNVLTIYERNRKEYVLTILRLFLFMGVSWILDIISYLCREYQSLAFFFDVTDFFNASQGVFIFILFVCRREVLNAIAEQFNIRNRRTSKRENQIYLATTAIPSPTCVTSHD